MSIAGTATYMLFSVIMGLTTGVSVVISRYYGAGEEDQVVKTFATSIYVAVVSAVLITAAGMLCTRPLLRILQTSEELMGEAAVTFLSCLPERREPCCTTGSRPCCVRWEIRWLL